MKRITSIALAIAMLVSAGMTAVAADKDFPFRDVPDDAWYRRYVEQAYLEGVMVGTGETTFAPNEPMTREEFVTALMRLANVNPPHVDVLTFADVKGGAWYAGYVEWARQVGVVSGVDDKNFGVGQPVTREQMAVMLSNFSHAVTGPSLLESEHPAPAFQDIGAAAAWAKGAVEEMRICGIVSGDENNRFQPKRAMTRAECATVLVKYQQARVDCGDFQLSFDNLTRMCMRSGASGLPTMYMISDQKEMQQLLDYINAAPIKSKKYAPSATGWTYSIDFWNGETYLNGIGIGADWVEVGNVRYYTEGDYFQSLLDEIDAKAEYIPLN
ncbi:MAG: S-layer homology domain-containing protein [Eubacteriales bacterium]|nr:S-layer homology domain-containing protein [Eubacteriales bacterium]